MGQHKERDLKIVTEEIENLRDVLNEVVADLESSEEEVLEISKALDELINEYMIKIKKSGWVKIMVKFKTIIFYFLW